ncbi:MULTISPECIES: FAD-dependent oxidoreductase [unclassified Rhizobium]|uniref:oxidoreductase n=1 Tax=unclassified Rhizobium TaxID=2613769 RepID=UPI00071376DE|nr:MULTISPECIES: FAD-dependent oxidoreductase [unclassified Rhizobium]KQS82405.1 oxidoreductase [Rhizobium sp. Leaf386]KQT02752.1 oxidoreductase [Rhizobium sp. Leaf391]KQU03471.1 oxidoreductase [Rhizobium sp. Leaf453]
MTSAFPKTFSEITLAGHTLRNRIVFGAHTANMSVNGLPGDQAIAYYVERAIGGAAMIVVEPMPVHPAAVLTRGNFRTCDDSVIPAFRKLTDSVKRHGAVIVQQLYHVGSHGDSDLSFHAHWSPSGGPSYHDSDGSHAMTEAQVEETIEAFVKAAQRCQAAGFDGVEVWAAYGGLLDQFWTPFYNKREDKWGGSLENRTRFSREILSRIRRLCGPDFIVGLTVSDEPGCPTALTRDEITEIVAGLDADGLIDYVTCGSGGYFDYGSLMPTFLYPERLGIELSARLKKVVTHALVTAESHIRTAENAEITLGEGVADLVSIVRGQIADPHLANKARRGTPEDIRGCLSCNQMCWGRRSRDYWISCLINPSVGREAEWGGDRFEPVTDPQSVLVVGGGPAGLEAARVAAERGHRVILAEASDRLGGAFRLAGEQPRRAQILDLIGWYETRFAKLGVEVRLNTYLEGGDVADIGADVVILATGSLPQENGFQKATPDRAELQGLGRGNVFSAESVMARQARVGTRVIVVDETGGWKGCGTAWKLAEQGHQVMLVTPDALVGKELQRTAADAPLRRTLSKLGVQFRTETSVDSWQGNAAVLISHLTGATETVPADSLVFATTNSAANWLALELADLGIAFQEIGDGVAPRQAPYAFYEGRKAGMGIAAKSAEHVTELQAKAV